MIILVLSIIISSTSGATVPGINTKLDLIPTVGSNNYGTSSNIQASANGKYVVFEIDSGSSNFKGLFKANLATSSSVRIDVSTNGTPSNTRVATPTAISATGRYVLFTSEATNLIDTQTTPYVGGTIVTYLRDTVAHTTELISKNPSGDAVSGIGKKISTDGRFILLTTDSATAASFHPEVANGIRNYIIDRYQNTVKPALHDTDGESITTNYGVDMSCDGAFVVFSAGGYVMKNAPPQGGTHIYLLDKRGDEDRISKLTAHANTSGGALAPSISCNGDYVGFKSSFTDIDPSVSMTNPTNGIYTMRPYIYDRINSETHLAAKDTNGQASTSPVTCESSAYPTSYNGNMCIKVSDNGTGVYKSNDPILLGISSHQAYLYNVHDGVTELVSKNINGDPANSNIGRLPDVSSDGRNVIYVSSATNLVTGDSAGKSRIIVSKTGY